MGKRQVNPEDQSVTVEQKNANGEASVFQRKDGRWCGQLVLPSGERKYLYAKSREEARDRLHKALSDAAKGLPVASGPELLGPFLERWLQDVVKPSVRPSTHDRYARDVRRHIMPELGKLKLTQLTPKVVQAFIGSLTKKGLKPRGVAHCRAVLRVALGHAETEELIGRNSARKVKLPRQVQKKVTPITADDARGILEAFKGDDLEHLITLALATGMRQGELLGLAWDGVDLDAGTLSVRCQLQRLGHVYELTELKTDKSRRTLSLPSIAVQALRAQRAKQVELRLFLGPAWEETERVFTSQTGGYLNGSYVTHHFQRRLEAAGLPSTPFHNLRHAAASLLLAQGASMRVVMEQLGHSQIALTMNTYAHIAPALLRENADRLQAALGG